MNIICLTYPNAYIYCDTDANYKEVGRIVFSPFELKIFEQSERYAKARYQMQEDYKNLGKKGEVRISACGQTAKIEKYTYAVIYSQFPADNVVTYRRTQKEAEDYIMQKTAVGYKAERFKIEKRKE